MTADFNLLLNMAAKRMHEKLADQIYTSSPIFSILTREKRGDRPVRPWDREFGPLHGPPTPRASFGEYSGLDVGLYNGKLTFDSGGYESETAYLSGEDVDHLIAFLQTWRPILHD